jgi:hypothetical protein
VHAAKIKAMAAAVVSLRIVPPRSRDLSTPSLEEAQSAALAGGGKAPGRVRSAAGREGRN